MDQKGRLIELLEADGGFSRYMTDDERRAKLADSLLANGVIVPPVKVGQTVYVITDCSKIFMYHDNDYFTGTGAIECPFEDACEFTECNDENTQVFETCVHFLLCDDCGDWSFNCEHINWAYNFNDIGNSVFFTKEEAEKALAERSNPKNDS